MKKNKVILFTALGSLCVLCGSLGVNSTSGAKSNVPNVIPAKNFSFQRVDPKPVQMDFQISREPIIADPKQ
ncbi:hypothetical protein [Cohnella zeiphila]|uniref:Uncharacterized protein n=1 Tax=Cohnella zeiphila TaxID=2761120 RepID=A0A7X0SMI9_9BACL|nr:hypothetical protein [Cohnella zeiphila]MBB6732717.1 hypothetical protein [Cohnella zeiphila]